MMTLEHERYGNARQCIRYMHIKYIAYALMFSSSLFEEHAARYIQPDYFVRHSQFI